MKKLNYFLTFVAGTMMMASCSNDAEVVSTVDDNAVQQIVLQVASNGDGLTTRAGRPLLSNEAAQDIQTVDLYIISNTTNEVVKKLPINWTSDATPYDYGKQTAITLKGADQLNASEKYTLFALGYSADTEYTIPDFSTSKKSDLENYKLQYTSSTSKSEEIFAGSIEFEVGSNGNFSETIVLNRQVAGAYFYVYKLPMLDGLDTKCKIQLVASDFNNQLVLGGFNSFDLTGNGTNNGTNVKYVVNGTKSENATSDYIVCEATIGDWYEEIKEKVVTVENEDDSEEETTTVKTGIVDSQYWIGTKNATTRKGSGYVKGSIFASGFVMPFKKVNNQTLKLQIVDQNNKLLHSWNVNLPADKIPSGSISYFNGSAFAEDAAKETKNVYSIVRNHLYCIGAKAKETPKTDPNNPTDPDPNDPDPDPTDPEDPQDISNVQDITLKVNHNWEVIYRMDLE